MSTINNPNIRTNLPNIPTLIENVVNQYIVRPGTPQQVGISGYVFDVVGTEELVSDADITDHFLEDNTAIQDHIALRPEKFTLSGYVGELKDIFQFTFLSILTNIQSLGTVFGLAPEFSVQATRTYAKIQDVASKVGEVFNQAQNIYDIFTQNSTTATKQQAAFKYFYDLQRSRILCQVETPYGKFDDMVIESIRAKQDESSRLISDFSITFKRIRTAKTIQFSSLKNIPAAGRAANLITNVVNNGSSSGIPVPKLGGFAEVKDTFFRKLPALFR